MRPYLNGQAGTWYTFSDGGLGFAEKRVVAATHVPFPHTFSRYSTLEEDREYVAAPLPPPGAAAEPAEPGSPKPFAPGDSATRYLALCRVIVGKVFITSKKATP